MNETQRIVALKREAWDARDFELFEFYNHIEYELKRLRAVGRAVAHLYQNAGNNEAAWNAIFEALMDAGLLDDSEVAHE